MQTMCTREPVTGSEDIIDTAKVHVPILTNPKIIQPGTELLVFKATKRPHGDSDIPLLQSEPAPKAQKTGNGKGTGKGRGKGRGTAHN